MVVSSVSRFEREGFGGGDVGIESGDVGVAAGVAEAVGAATSDERLVVTDTGFYVRVEGGITGVATRV